MSPLLEPGAPQDKATAICLLGLLDGSGGGVPGRLDSLVKGVALSLAFMEHHCAGHHAGALSMSSFSPHSDLGAGLAVFSIYMVETEPPMQGQEIVLSHFWGHRGGGMCSSVRSQVRVWPLHGQNLLVLSA